MPNVVVPNLTLAATGEYFHAIWKKTRALLAAGYKYKAAGNGQAAGTKDTSGNPSLDPWSVGGAVNLTNTGRASGAGAGVNIGAANATTGLSVVSGLAGALAASVGCYLTIVGSNIPANNGPWRITAQAGTSVTVYAPGMTAETANAAISAIEQQGGAAASVGAFSTTTSGQSPLITITGLTGLVAPTVVGGVRTANGSEGHLLSLINPSSGANVGTWLIATVLSPTSCLVYNPSGVPGDLNNGSIQWVEVDPLSMVYPSYMSGANGVGAWLNMQGPTTLLIPIGANAPVGTSTQPGFIRGENVVQTSTGAQGCVRGVVVDTAGGTGFLVIEPRVFGTGARASSQATYGWNNSAFTDTITGSLSGVTVTTPANSTPRAFVREFVWWKNTAQLGHVYHQCIDQATESATTAINGRFSVMAASGTVTSQLAPGGSAGGNPTTNGFPTTGTYCVIGTGGSGGASTGSAEWPGLSTPNTPGKAQIMVANAVEQQNVSADGTWRYAQSAAASGYLSFSFEILDNSEDGDVDPYVTAVNGSGTLNGAPNRTADTTGSGSATDNATLLSSTFTSGNNHVWKGWRRRGLSSETFAWFSTAILADVCAPIGSIGAVAGNTILDLNAGNPDQVATAPVVTYVREPIWAYLTPWTAQNLGVRMRKGTPRWLFTVQGGSANRTLDSEAWVILSSSALPFVAGPWDNATTPVF